MSDSIPAAVSLDALLAALELPPHGVQAFDPAYPRFDAQRPLLVLAPQFEAARPELRRRYPPAASVRVMRDGAVFEASVAALPFDAAAWLLPALAPEDDRRSLAGLRGVMERLFAPDGCPWDREQTPETLRRYLLEEVYELVDAIDRDDAAGLREEIGDVLAHMFMQTALSQQAGAFALEDAVEYATDKFVRRHPHVFGDAEADSGAGVQEAWEAIKRSERAARAGDEPPEGALDSVPQAAPALQRAQALIGRARRAGLGEPPLTAAELLERSLDRSAGRSPGDAGLSGVLFAAVLLAREDGVDAEETLREAASRFTAAFVTLEAEARAAGIDAGDLPEERRASVWASVWRAPRSD